MPQVRGRALRDVLRWGGIVTAPVPDHAALPVERLRVTPPTPVPTWHVFHNGIDWFAAIDADHAERRAREYYGRDEAAAEGPWERLPDNDLLTVDDDGVKVVFPCSWWATNPGSASGLICSTEY